MPEPDALLEEAFQACRESIRVGSKSFSLVSKLFDEKTRDASMALYGWCRHCDDEIDFSHKGFVVLTDRYSDKKNIQAERLHALVNKTKSVYLGRKQTDPIFLAFEYVVRQYKIPEKYPLELLEGMAMDARQQTYPTMGDLLLYCYRVAGTVGLMMSHIIGVSDPKALKHAAYMGIAMQLTNISRDVIEDADHGRIYLPLNWLKDWGISTHELSHRKNREKVYHLTSRLLTLAEEYYAVGEAGLKYLPLRAATTIAAARYVYGDIGIQIKKQGAHAWDKRSTVPLWRKLTVMSKGLGRVMVSVPQRAIKPWRKIQNQAVYNYS